MRKVRKQGPAIYERNSKSLIGRGYCDTRIPVVSRTRTRHNHYVDVPLNVDILFIIPCLQGPICCF